MNKKPRVIQGKADMAPPWEPCEVTIPELQAIHALVIGEATADHQRHFLAWFKRATAINEMEFRPNDRESAFAGGKRFVGNQFFTLAKARLPSE